MDKYGYKVCYREYGKWRYIWRFLTYTRIDAKDMLAYYIRYPPLDIPNITWKIVPITRREYNAGIWEQCPF